MARRLAALLAAAAASSASSAPNVLFLMADQMRADAPGYAGNPYANTPNLDALAARSLRFNRFYSTTPTCTPARSSILTGLSPWWHGMLGYADVPTGWPLQMPAFFSSHGYRTASIGKNHFWTGTQSSMVLPPSHGYQEQYLYDGLGNGRPNTTQTQEFDSYDAWFDAVTGGADPLATGNGTMDWNSWRAAPYVYDEQLHPTAWVGRTAVGWLQNYSASARLSEAAGGAAAPFFLKVSFHRPHSPYDPPARLLNATMGVPPLYAGGNWCERYTRNGAWCGPSDADAWCGTMPEAAANNSRRGYGASIAFVDEHIGALLSELNASGLVENTYILFVSDHGDGQGDLGLWRKGFPYEISTHVPALFAWPPSVTAAVPRGSSTDAIGELRDVFPTLAAVAGLALPPGAVNGSALGCLALTDPSGGSCGPGGGAWRTWIDLEHDVVFNETVHWSAATGLLPASGSESAGAAAADGVRVSSSSAPSRRWKYVFRALDGEEQLFDLDADPYEQQNVAALAANEGVLATWRGRLAAQYEAEGRGPTWTKGGRLLPRPPQLYSPHFPSSARS